LYVPDDPNSNKLLDEIEASIGDFNARSSIGRALAYKGYDASEIVRSAYVPTASDELLPV
jgi:hypothetical protein